MKPHKGRNRSGVAASRSTRASPREGAGRVRRGTRRRATRRPKIPPVQTPPPPPPERVPRQPHRRATGVMIDRHQDGAERSSAIGKRDAARALSPGGASVSPCGGRAGKVAPPEAEGGPRRISQNVRAVVANACEAEATVQSATATASPAAHAEPVQRACPHTGLLARVRPPRTCADDPSILLRRQPLFAQDRVREKKRQDVPIHIG